MSVEKLDKWAELLLDTGKRNNLINFKDTKASTVEVVYPSVAEVFDRLTNGSAPLEVFEPKAKSSSQVEVIDSEVAEIIGDGADADAAAVAAVGAVDGAIVLAEAPFASSAAPAASVPADAAAAGSKVKTSKYTPSRQETISTFGGKLKKNQVLLYSRHTTAKTVVRNLKKKAESAFEETGVNVAYAAFGFISWKEHEGSNDVYHAPLLLIPLKIANPSALDPCTLSALEDDVVVNPTFNYKLANEYGIHLPEYTDQGFDAYFAEARLRLAKLQWDIVPSCKLGLFSFQKINMYRDVKDNADKMLKSDNIRALLGEKVESNSNNYPSTNNGERPGRVTNPLVQLHNVVDADSSQVEAIQMVREGKSFVLQGPPGTGKSQTITNIVAECLYMGKTVLFVSEKQAALNVVYDKLKKNGLEDFCLELHSSKANKRDVINELCRVLNADATGVSSRAEAVVADKEKYQTTLEGYETALHKEREGIGLSLYQVFERYYANRDYPDVFMQIPGVSLKGLAYLHEAVDLLEQYAGHASAFGGDYRNSIWMDYHGGISLQQRVELSTLLSGARDSANALAGLIKRAAADYEVTLDSVESLSRFVEALLYLGKSQEATPLLLNEQSKRFELSTLVQQITSLNDNLAILRSWIDARFKPSVYRINGFGLKQRLEQECSGLFKSLNKTFKELSALYMEHSNTGAKPSYDELRDLARNLCELQENAPKLNQMLEFTHAYLPEGYVPTDWKQLLANLKELDQFCAKGYCLGTISRRSSAEYAECRGNFTPFGKELANTANSYWQNMSGLEKVFSQGLFNPRSYDFPSVASLCDKYLGGIDSLSSWAAFSDAYGQMKKLGLLGFVDVCTEQKVLPTQMAGAYKKLFFFQWASLIIDGDQALRTFSRPRQDHAAANFADCDKRQFEVSKAQIKAKLSANRPQMDMISVGGAPSILLREGQKKRRQKSIRTLMSEIGELVQILKPCFMMSPLSVSTFLAPNAVHFDVVVFDEASQVFPQDAIGSIYRGDQLIVVGDSRQMPPSNFFMASEVGGDYDDDETEDVTDFESILDLCSTCFPQRRLNWHYRSRCESLITFSNANFYGSGLVTFPSARDGEADTGVKFTHVNGVFNRTRHVNMIEAQATVDLVFDHIRNHKDRSLGVVAFSQAQQRLIEALVEKRRLEDDSCEDYFRADSPEPFFVKNLETVQGDERDTIIFSIAYAPDEAGKFYLNFGPLNRVGGERRLNVAVTRAKMCVQVVSSIHATDIDLSRSKAEGVRLLRAYLDYAENGAIAIQRELDVNEFEQFDSEFETEVYEFLRSQGITVDTQVGCSGYRIDLGVRLPNSSQYVLAVECDGASYHSSKNARDRDRLRQEVLERMGWDFYRIWSTDWFKNNAAEKQNLLAAVRAALEKAASGESASMRGANADAFDSEAASAAMDALTHEAAAAIGADEASDVDAGKAGGEDGADELFCLDAEAGVAVFEESRMAPAPVEDFEVAVERKGFQFPEYKLCEPFIYRNREYGRRAYEELCCRIVEEEAPINDEWLQRRLVSCFDREKVTKVTRDLHATYFSKRRHDRYVLRGGYWFKRGEESVNEIEFRVSDKDVRPFEYICAEELAAGLYEIIRLNISIEKHSLYGMLMEQLGLKRVTAKVNAQLDKALWLLGVKAEDGEVVTLG